MAEQLGHAAVVARLRAVVAEQLRAARAVAVARTAVAQTAQTAEAAGQAALAEHAFAALGQQVRKTPSWPRSWANFNLK